MADGCLQAWFPSTNSYALVEDSRVLPDVKMYIHDLPASSRPYSTTFHLCDSPVEFLYCLSGGVQIFATDSANRNVYAQVEAGESGMLFLPRCIGHCVSKPSCPLRMVGLQICPEKLHCLYGMHGNARHPHLCKAFQNNMLSCVFAKAALPLPMRVTASHILDCHHARDRRELFLEYKKVELFYFQLSLLDSHLATLKNIGRTEMQAVHRACEILLADLTNPPGLHELAAQVGLSRSRLTLLFRTLYGDTVFGVVRKERLECARRMLENGMSVTEVAYECGFSSPSHLTKAFAECYGLCPKRYQAECGGRRMRARKRCMSRKIQKA